jgi:hypothetical protein
MFRSFLIRFDPKKSSFSFSQKYRFPDDTSITSFQSGTGGEYRPP